VPTPLFDDPRVLATSHSLIAPQMQMSSYAASLARTHFMRSEGFRTEAEWPAKAIVDLNRLGKGVSWALAIECTAALSLYVVWQLCHLWL
jgi:hypothetical protein